MTVTTIQIIGGWIAEDENDDSVHEQCVRCGATRTYARLKQ